MLLAAGSEPLILDHPRHDQVDIPMTSPGIVIPPWKETPKMNEAAITHSPHAFVPKRYYTAEEERELYRTRIDASFKPYTVIDVLRLVYHRTFEHDLVNYIGEHPEQFMALATDKHTFDEWGLARAWVNSMHIIRVESVFFQSSTNFKVDLVAETRIKMVEEKRGNSFTKRQYTIKPTVRLRYSFDFRICHLDCFFDKVITDEKESLYNQDISDDYNPHLDRYLLPVLTDKDYQLLAIIIREQFFNNQQAGAIDPMDWVRIQDLDFRFGVFPENGTLGEYFFNFGTADVINPETGAIVRGEKINPGTVIINKDIANTRGAFNSSVTHEMTHSVFGMWFFLLQRTHGHDYCSYMCKRHNGEAEAYSPITKMEYQANIFPRFLLIPQTEGKRFIEEKLADYGGERNLTNISRLICDLAEEYGATKTMARSRLADFGYAEAKGMMQTVDGRAVPSYLSDLNEDETYTISVREGIQEYIRNPEFRAVIDTGRYLYVAENAVYCLNDARYIAFDQFDVPHLRRHALENMRDCCLPFKIKYENVFMRVVNGILQKGKSAGGISKQFRGKYVNQDGTSAATEEGLAAKKRILAMRADEQKYRESFGMLLGRYMENKKVTKGMLAEATGLSEDTIKNMRNKNDILFDIKSVLAVVIALGMTKGEAEDFITRSPAKFADTEDMFIYKHMFYTRERWTVGAFNRVMVDMDVPPLTNLVDGFDEMGRKIGA